MDPRSILLAMLPVGLTLKTAESALHESAASCDIILQQTMVEVLSGYNADVVLRLEDAFYVVDLDFDFVNALVGVGELRHELI